MQTNNIDRIIKEKMQGAILPPGEHDRVIFILSQGYTQSFLTAIKISERYANLEK